MTNKVILLILDGFGVAPPGPGNAIYLANPTTYNSILFSYPNTTLSASGISVGLPQGEAGNTEVGHLNIGAGRIVYQDLPRINMAIADGSFYENSAFLNAVEHVKKNDGKLHILGLVGGETSVRVHSNIEHLYALLYLAKEKNIAKVFVHAITDGRDSPPKSGETIVKQLEEKMKQMGIGKIASVIGRYYAMDRDRRWERTEQAYLCLTKGLNINSSSLKIIEDSYNNGVTDEFILPSSVASDNGTPLALVEKGDAIIFFNYRIDRPRQLTKAFVLDNFEKDANNVFSFDPYAVKYYKTHIPSTDILTSPFNRGRKIENLKFVTMTEYEKGLTPEVAFPPITIPTPLGRVLSERGVSQLRMSESEKERFVTFYFNGQNENAFPLEDRLIIPSPKVPTYDLKPEMSAYELTNVLLTKMRDMKYQFIVINFANPDMVGHTGNIQSTISAIKTIDICLNKLVSESLSLGYTLLITADHGNAEQKINPETGEISTEHTNNPVPFIVIDSKYQGKYTKLQTGILADVAPTILGQLDIPKPEDMTGRNLLSELR